MEIMREQNEVESCKNDARVRYTLQSSRQCLEERQNKSIQCEMIANGNTAHDSFKDNNDSSYFVLPAELKPLRELYGDKYYQLTSANEKLQVEIDTVRRECSRLTEHNGKLADDLKRALEDVSSIPLLQSRNEALTRQISSIPASVTIAHAEKRVAEAKLSQIRDEFRNLFDEERQKTAQIQFELNAFMRREEIERRTLLEKNQTQAHTIHQLTKHIKQLQSSLDVGCGESQISDCLGVSGTGDVAMPLPWPLSDPLRSTKSNGKDCMSASDIYDPIESPIVDSKDHCPAQKYSEYKVLLLILLSRS